MPGTDRRRALLGDAALAAGLAAVNSASLLQLAHPDSPQDLWGWELGGHLTGAGLALLLLLRRTCPVPVALAMMAGGLAAEWAGAFAWAGASFGIVAAAYAVGRWMPLARSTAGIAVVLIADTAALAVSVQPAEGPWWGRYAFALGTLAAAWWLGRVVRSRASTTTELAERAQRLERTRDAQIRAVVAEERSRIARELHDVVAHHVSVMTVQATAGRKVIARRPERAEQALQEIERTGRQTLDEMRRLVGVLRTPEDGIAGPDRGPQPGVDDLGALLASVCDAGVAARLRVTGSERALPPLQGVTVYRLVQEALTNVLKHGGTGTAADVHLSYEPDALVVEVTDDGAGTAAPGSGGEGPGHGLLGMRERAALFGGSLTAAPARGGGFTVRARIPF